MFNLHLSLVGVLLSLSIGFGSFSVSASAQSANPYGNRDMDAPLTEENAYSLPQVHVLDATIQREAGSILGSFTVFNSEAFSVGALQYILEIRENNSAVDNPILFEKHAVRDQFLMKGNEKREMSFHLDLPALPKRTYDLRIQLASSDGRYLGWKNMPFEIVDGTTHFVEFSNPILKTEEFGAQELEPLSGPNVSPNKKLSLEVTVKNPTSTDLTVFPVLALYEFDISRGEGTPSRFPEFTIKAGESKQFVLPLTAHTKPEVYEGLLQFIDSKTALPVSPIAVYHWVVRGVDADVFPLRIFEIGTKKDDQTIADVSFVGAADAETVIQGSALIELIDAKGVLAMLETPVIPLTDGISSGKASLKLTRDAEGVTAIRVTVKDDKGTILATRDTPLSDTTTSTSAQTTSSLLFPFLLVAGLLACALLFFAAKRRNSFPR